VVPLRAKIYKYLKTFVGKLMIKEKYVNLLTTNFALHNCIHWIANVTRSLRQDLTLSVKFY